MAATTAWSFSDQSHDSLYGLAPASRLDAFVRTRCFAPPRGAKPMPVSSYADGVTYAKMCSTAPRLFRRWNNGRNGDDWGAAVAAIPPRAHRVALRQVLFESSEIDREVVDF